MVQTNAIIAANAYCDAVIAELARNFTALLSANQVTSNNLLANLTTEIFRALAAEQILNSSITLVMLNQEILTINLTSVNSTLVNRTSALINNLSLINASLTSAVLNSNASLSSVIYNSSSVFSTTLNILNTSLMNSVLTLTANVSKLAAAAATSSGGAVKLTSRADNGTVDTPCNTPGVISMGSNSTSFIYFCDGNSWKQLFGPPFGTFTNPGFSCAQIFTQSLFIAKSDFYYVYVNATNVKGVYCYMLPTTQFYGDGSKAALSSYSCATLSTQYNITAGTYWINNTLSMCVCASGTCRPAVTCSDLIGVIIGNYLINTTTGCICPSLATCRPPLNCSEWSGIANNINSTASAYIQTATMTNPFLVVCMFNSSVSYIFNSSLRTSVVTSSSSTWNSFFSVNTAFLTSGATSFSILNQAGAQPVNSEISIGTLVIIMQMQTQTGANVGNYEFGTVLDLNNGILTLADPIVRAYRSGGYNAWQNSYRYIRLFLAPKF